MHPRSFPHPHGTVVRITAVIAALLLASESAAGQPRLPGHTLAHARTDTFDVHSLRGGELRLMHRIYEQVLTVRVDGRPALLRVRWDDNPQAPALDSVFVDPETLLPVRSHWSWQGQSLALTFSGTRVRGRASGPDGTQAVDESFSIAPFHPGTDALIALATVLHPELPLRYPVFDRHAGVDPPLVMRTLRMDGRLRLPAGRSRTAEAVTVRVEGSGPTLVHFVEPATRRYLGMRMAMVERDAILVVPHGLGRDEVLAYAGSPEAFASPDAVAQAALAAVQARRWTEVADLHDPDELHHVRAELLNLLALWIERAERQPWGDAVDPNAELHRPLEPPRALAARWGKVAVCVLPGAASFGELVELPSHELFAAVLGAVDGYPRRQLSPPPDGTRPLVLQDSTALVFTPGEPKGTTYAFELRLRGGRWWMYVDRPVFYRAFADYAFLRMLRAPRPFPGLCPPAGG